MASASVATGTVVRAKPPRGRMTILMSEDGSGSCGIGLRRGFFLLTFLELREAFNITDLSCSVALASMWRACCRRRMSAHSGRFSSSGEIGSPSTSTSIAIARGAPRASVDTSCEPPQMRRSACPERELFQARARLVRRSSASGVVDTFKRCTGENVRFWAKNKLLHGGRGARKHY